MIIGNSFKYYKKSNFKRFLIFSAEKWKCSPEICTQSGIFSNTILCGSFVSPQMTPLEKLSISRALFDQIKQLPGNTHTHTHTFSGQDDHTMSCFCSYFAGQWQNQLIGKNNICICNCHGRHMTTRCSGIWRQK